MRSDSSESSDSLLGSSQQPFPFLLHLFNISKTIAFCPVGHQVILKARLNPLLLLLFLFVSVHDAYLSLQFSFCAFFCLYRVHFKLSTVFRIIIILFLKPQKYFLNKSKFHAIVHIIREGLLALFFVLCLSDLIRYEFFFGIFPGGGSCLAAKILPHSPYTVHHHNACYRIINRLSEYHFTTTFVSSWISRLFSSYKLFFFFDL